MRLPSSISRVASVPFAVGLLIGIAGTAGAATVLGSDVFRDVPDGSYYDSAVGEMYDIGVIKGNPDGSFNPGGFVTRADIAVMLKRLRDEMTGNVETSSSSRDRSSSSSSRSSSSSSSSTSVAVSNPKGFIRFTTSELRVPENISTKKITIAVVRTAGNEGTVTVEYTTSDGTATEGTDYTKSSGTLTFANGETSKTFDVSIKDDSSGEGNETVTVTLSNPGNGVSMGTPISATLIITDDETGSSSSTSTSATSSSSSTGPSVGFSATQYSIDEDMSTLTITVARAGSSSSTATVNYATVNGTAKSGSEYTSVSGTLSFGANEASKTFTIPIANDTSDDGAKSFTINLTNAVNATLTSNLGTATVTINDDETVEFGSGSFKLSKSTYAIDETSGQAIITVQRTGGSTFQAAVNYATTGLSANSGTDFTYTSGTLTFAAGESAKIFIVPITKDDIADSGETFGVDLSGATNNVPLISPYSATVTIE